MEAHLDCALRAAVVEQASIGVRVAGLTRLLQPSIEPGDRIVDDRRACPAALAGTASRVWTPRCGGCSDGRREVQVRSASVGQGEYRHSGRLPESESTLVKLRIGGQQKG